MSFFLLYDKADAPDQNSSTPTPTTQVNPSKQQSGKFKTYTGQEFSDLYNSFNYPNTSLINEHSLITGEEAADSKIRQLAVSRGYKLRSAPVANNFVEVQKTMLLQERASKPWLDLQKKAKEENIRLSLFDAYRSAEDQRKIFLSRLSGISVSDIAVGKADVAVNKVLETTALPGYSRHHTGYTVDIKCDSQPAVKFENSSCFVWLSKDNYLNAKKHGWIPSYPEGAGNQGPLPESWEYVWVGANTLQE
ncbi:MAG TPA: D-alanyl-D-alanine carboxypeptidase family protein [Patescibacteria group bacterium]|nr:D-alanyl-D-alanine carboxypeptidase family protein [Patescibacteria group bacterium]